MLSLLHSRKLLLDSRKLCRKYRIYNVFFPDCLNRLMLHPSLSYSATVTIGMKHVYAEFTSVHHVTAHNNIIIKALGLYTINAPSVGYSYLVDFLQ